MGPSKRAGGIVQSDIRAMTRACEARGGINLGQGLCDLPTPALVARGAREAIADRRATYSAAEGTPELRLALARKTAREQGVTRDPMTEIVITIGSTGAYVSALHALLDPGDTILLTEPAYAYHEHAATLAGVQVRRLPLSPPEFRIEEQRLRAAAQGVRALVLCTPNNPTGRVLDDAELDTVARVAEELDLLVLSDEVYEYLVFDGRRHRSPATVRGLADRTVVLGSLSKTFSITGWRIGWAAGPRPLLAPIRLVNDFFYVCAPTPLQVAAARGLDAPAHWFTALGQLYERRRDRFCEGLRRAGLDPIVPEGAYYTLANIDRLGCATSKDAAMTLLDRVGVASVPGSAFLSGPDGERLVRFCFAKEDDVLDEAISRLARL